MPLLRLGPPGAVPRAGEGAHHAAGRHAARARSRRKTAQHLLRLRRDGRVRHRLRRESHQDRQADPPRVRGARRLRRDDRRRRGGLAVVLGVAKPSDSTSVRTMTLPFEEKTLTGSYFGSCVPRVDFPRMLALYLGGNLKLEELITRRYPVEEAPQAFADLESGRNARGVIVFPQ